MFFLAAVLCLCVGAVCSAEGIPAEAADLVPDTPADAVISDGEPAWFRFIPEETTVYAFYSSCDSDTYACLYKKSGEDGIVEIAVDDDGGVDRNFRIIKRLDADSEYYYSAFFLDGSDGSFPVMIEKYTGLTAERTNDSEILYETAGESVTLGVTASSGRGEVIFRWAEKDGDGLWGWMEGKTTPEIIVTAAAGEKQYRCRVSDGVSEILVDYTVTGMDYVEAEADSETDFLITPGASAGMKVRASSVSGVLVYEWYKSWNDRSGNWHEEKVSGADSAIYTAENIRENCIYRCCVNSTYGTGDVSFSISIDAPVTASPAGEIEREVTCGGSAEMTVTADEEYGPLGYQWYRQDYDYGETAIEGATAASYTAENIQCSSTYFCRVTNEYDAYSDVPFYISVEGDYRAYPSIRDICPEPGESCELRVSAEAFGDVLTYQWYGPVPDKRDTPQIIPEQTGDTYTIEHALSAGYYLCRVVNAAGIEKNIWFHVGINGGLTADPANSVYGYADGEVTLSADAYSPAGEVACQWYIEDDEQPGFEHAHLIENAAVDPYIIASPEKECTVYYCAVSDVYGNTTIIRRNVYISGELSAEGIGEYSQHIRAGESAVFEVSASGSGRITYQWQKAGVLENGEWGPFEDLEGAASDTCTIENVRNRMQVRCVVSNTFGDSTSVDFDLFLDNGLQLTVPGCVYAAPNESVTLTAQADCLSGSIHYQWFEQKTDIFGCNADIKIEGATEASYTTEPITGHRTFLCVVTDDYCNGDGASAEVFVDNQLTSDPEDYLNVRVCPGETADLQVTASVQSGEITYHWFRECCDEEGNWYEAEIPDAAGNSITTEPINRTGLYYCRVSDIYGNKRTICFYIEVDNILSVHAVGEQELSLDPGATVTLEVSATAGTGDVHYQWSTTDEDGFTVTISDATGAACTIGPVTRAVQYACDVTDDYGNQEQIFFNIGINSGLTAQAAGPDFAVVEPGERATFTVEAGVNIGDVHYRWYADYGTGYREVAGAGQSTLITEKISRYTRFFCVVSDDYGNSQSLYFDAITDNGLGPWIQFDLTAGMPEGEPEDLGYELCRKNVWSGAPGIIHSCTRQHLDNGHSRITVRYTVAPLVHRSPAAGNRDPGPPDAAGAVQRSFHPDKH